MPTKKDLWYELAIMSNASEPSNHIWNGYMRHLMENNRMRHQANEVKVMLNDGEEDYQEVGLPELRPHELEEVQDIGLPEDMDKILFNGYGFDENADFISFYFPTRVSFRNAKFECSANFKNAKFEYLANFKNASFAKRANFKNASFAKLADFSKAQFEHLANFTDASFAKRANFKNASFAKRANFSKAQFEGDADFSVSSDTPPPKGSVSFASAAFSFASATFKLAPSFFNRQLHEDTDWQNVYLGLSKEQAGYDVRRYECLSLMMSNLEKYDDMHTFFRRSMRAKEIRDGRWSVTFLMSRIYGTLYDYGRGVGRAFLLWFCHILLGSIFIYGLLQPIGVGKSLALSFSNAHSFIGLHSDAMEKLYHEAAGCIPEFNVIWGVQTVIGLPLLFFLLLTLRNRFRMR